MKKAVIYALTNWIMQGIEIFGPIFVILRGVCMGRHTLAGRPLPGRDAKMKKRADAQVRIYKITREADLGYEPSSRCAKHALPVSRKDWLDTFATITVGYRKATSATLLARKRKQPANTRRLRDLAEEGRLEAQYRKDHAQFRLKQADAALF